MKEQNDRIAALRKKAATLPLCPGVYLMRDARGNIIYVGKSAKLRNRVASYFSQQHRSPKTARMVSLVADFDYILCDGEMEALALENTLIKEHAPKYNIKLKDAKSYPYIKITQEEYPRLLVTRQRLPDKGKYFGPYQSSATAHEALDVLNRIFGLPTCRRSFPRDIGRERPCLYRQMGRCVAPCTGEVGAEKFRELVRCAGWVLEGNTKGTEAALTEAMGAAAESEQFELAARYRDSIAALRRLGDRQKVVADESVSRDVFALYEDELSGVLAVLNIRAGKLLNKNEFLFSAGELTEAADLPGLLIQYYRDVADYPREILTDFPLEESEYPTLASYFSHAAGARVLIRTPKRGELRELCDMALANAKQRAERYRAETEREDKTLVLLSQMLGLEVIADRIEAFDISNIGREHITASMVVFENGKPKRSDYRTFSIRTTDGIDDYGAMREALSRRLAHIGDGSASLGKRPDLILLDGGVGHVRTVREVACDLGHPDIPLFGMVKDDFHKTRAITDGEREIGIAAEQAVYVLIYRIQEEAHRVAVSHTMAAKSRSLRRSTLEDIPGIGKAKAARLLAAFGSIARLSAAEEGEIARLPGFGKKDEEAIRAHLKKRADKKNQTKKGDDPS
jgi:excinuclease ABC subunit C